MFAVPLGVEQASVDAVLDWQASGSGNALAKNQVRLIATGREVTTTVDTIKDMDHQQIYNFILGRS